MPLKKVKTIFRSKLKPLRFRFKGNIRLGFRGNKIVEVTKYKKLPYKANKRKWQLNGLIHKDKPKNIRKDWKAQREQYGRFKEML